MDLQARVAAITQSVMAWQIARDCEINFNGRGNVSRETGCFGEMGCHFKVPALVPPADLSSERLHNDYNSDIF